MPTWDWQGRNRHGHWCRGQSRAESPRRLTECLADEGVVVLHHRRRWFPATRPGVAETIWLLRQWATLLEAGVPLVGSLAVIATGARRRPLDSVIAALCRQLESGLALSVAMSRHACFDAGLCLAVSAGEQTGRLARALDLWADMQEQRRRLKQQARSALLYPGFVLAIALLMLTIMLLTVVPTFSATFASAGRELPAATRVVLFLSGALHDPASAVLLALWVPFLPSSWLRRYPAALFWRDGLLLRLPLLGTVLRQAALARWSRTLALLLAAGVPVLDAIGPACQGSASRFLAARAGLVRHRLQAGTCLHDALQETGFFPPLLLQLIHVGETSGALDRLCLRAADHFEQETARALQRFMAMLEPAAMLLLGLLCAFLLWALYLPIFQLGDILT